VVISYTQILRGAILMPTILFDFDSTIINCESLEKILISSLKEKPDLLHKIREITEEGIRGQRSFEYSLESRLKIAAPSFSQVMDFGKTAYKYLTYGMLQLFHELHESQIDLWIISGGVLESLLDVGNRLGVPENQIRGVKFLWDEKGEFAAIDKKCLFYRSKVEGCKSLVHDWSPPTIAIGDAMSDYRLYSQGLVQYFIAYTEHVRCTEVLNEKNVLEAKNTSEVRDILKGILNGKIIVR